MNSLETTIRSLARARGFSLIVVLILAFGIGVNTAMFSLIDAVLLRPLSYPNPDRLVTICMPHLNDPFAGFDYPDYLDIRTSQRTFEAVGVVHYDFVHLTS